MTDFCSLNFSGERQEPAFKPSLGRNIASGQRDNAFASHGAPEQLNESDTQSPARLSGLPHTCRRTLENASSKQTNKQTHTQTPGTWPRTHSFGGFCDN